MPIILCVKNREEQKNIKKNRCVCVRFAEILNMFPIVWAQCFIAGVYLCDAKKSHIVNLWHLLNVVNVRFSHYIRLDLLAIKHPNSRRTIKTRNRNKSFETTKSKNKNRQKSIFGGKCTAAKKNCIQYTSIEMLTNIVSHHRFVCYAFVYK